MINKIIILVIISFLKYLWKQSMYPQSLGPFLQYPFFARQPPIFVASSWIEVSPGVLGQLSARNVHDHAATRDLKNYLGRMGIFFLRRFLDSNCQLDEFVQLG